MNNKTHFTPVLIWGTSKVWLHENSCQPHHTPTIYAVKACGCPFGHLCGNKTCDQKLNGGKGKSQNPGRICGKANSVKTARSCKRGYGHSLNKGETKTEQWPEREIPTRFTTLSQGVAVNVLSPFFHLIRQAQGCRSRLDNKHLLDTPPVVKRGTAEYLSQLYSVEIYCLN